MKTVLKQPEKNAQRDPGEKGWACYYYGKEGHLKWDCPQVSKLPPAPCLVCKGPHWKRGCPQVSGVRPSRQSGLKVPRGPHTSLHPNYTWGTPGINNCGGPIHRFPFRYWGNLLHAYWSPWPTFFPIRFHNETVWMSQNVLLQCFCQLWLGFSAIFTQVSECARVSLTPFGEGYTEQGPCPLFHEYGAFLFSPFKWTKCKS